MSHLHDERRSNERVRSPLSVTVRHMRRQDRATLRDISPAGMYLDSSPYVEEGADIELVFMMPQEVPMQGGHWVSCFAKVVRVDSKVRGQYGVAAKITLCEPVELN